MSTGIYLIHNKINNKNYVGQSVHIETRWTEHKNSIHRSNKNPLITQALRKYGIENFDFLILEKTSMEQLDEREQYWIQFYNSVSPNGYNLQLGGKSGSMVCPQDILDIIDLLQKSSMTMEQIAEEYFISLRTVIRINQGDVWFNNNYTYPLRPRPQRTHGDGLTICPLCGGIKGRDATYCITCAHIAQRQVERPSKEDLAQEIVQSSFTKVGEKYGVTDNAIRKWCKNYGLPTHKKELKQWLEDNTVVSAK